MLLVLVCNGERENSENNPDFSREVVDYKKLTKTGQSQSLHLGIYLKETLGSVDEFLVSPCISAVVTGENIYSHFSTSNTSFTQVHSLAEFNQVECEVYQNDTVSAKSIAQKRVKNWLEAILSDPNNTGKTIIVVTHETVIQNLLDQINIDRTKKVINDASYSVIVKGRKGVKIESINNTVPLDRFSLSV
jgi:phosphohistidine phosphatase SixA